MAIVETVVTYRNKSDFMRRVERKNSKSDMSRILADFHWVLSDEALSNDEKIKALESAHQRICWG